jgi:hypothetical integral membrane protein (TIGR02206 family)
VRCGAESRAVSAGALDDHPLVHPERKEPPGRLCRAGEGAPAPARFDELGAHDDLVADFGATKMVDQDAGSEVGHALDRSPERGARDDLEEQGESRAREHERVRVRVTESGGSVCLADDPASRDDRPERREGWMGRARGTESSAQLVCEVSRKDRSRLSVRSDNPECLGERDEDEPLLRPRQAQAGPSCRRGVRCRMDAPFVSGAPFVSSAPVFPRAGLALHETSLRGPPRRNGHDRGPRPDSGVRTAAPRKPGANGTGRDTRRRLPGENGKVRVLSLTYVVTLATMVFASAALCIGARRHPGSWIALANATLATLLVAVSAIWLVQTSTAPNWSASTSLPFALCDLTTLVAAAALLTREPLLVELTYFWGLAGALQALLTPDLATPFPSLEFFEYVIAHAGIVCAAVFLVVGQGLAPRPGAVPRTFAITAGCTALVGGLDAATGGNYMYLRHLPAAWTLLSVLGPWPWYLVSAAGVALAALSILDAPFWPGRARRRSASRPPVPTPS